MKIFILFICLTSYFTLSANEEIDNLLNDIHHKSDLSEKTKLANYGISQIFTRDDLHRMQARYLKDVLKSGYFTKYFENRYGVTDPLVQGFETIPFKSSTIRIYIDNQEVTAGSYGSGMTIYGSLDIGFVDHIEIYTQAPTYEYSTETSVTLIKLYSKSIKKDEGSKVELNAGTYGALRVSGYNSSYISDDWSHLTYISLDNKNRQEHNSFGEKLSRDAEVIHLFSSISNDNQRVLIDITDQKRDAFMGISADATPTESLIDFQSIHLGYDTNIDNFSFLFTYDYSYTDYKFSDDVTPLINTPLLGPYPFFEQHTKTKSEVFTGDIKYNLVSKNNQLITGIKYRLKTHENETLEINNNPLPEFPSDTQTVFTFFIEDKYSIFDNHIITLGVQYSDVHNNHSLQDDQLYMYRFGYTFIKNDWTSKTVIAHTESTLEPYMVDSYLYLTPGIKEPQEADYITQDFIFEDQDSTYEVVLGYMKLKNTLLQDPTCTHLDNYKEDIFVASALLRWTYIYNNYDKLYMNFDYKDTSGLFNLGHVKNYTGVIRNLNTYKKFDFFSEVLYNYINIEKEHYYDLSLGVRYKHTDALTFSIKGENLFDNAQTTSYTRVNPLTLTPEEALSISPVDRKITLSLEYLF